MENKHGSSWDPNVAGPFDRCQRCWAPHQQDRAYCTTCGYVSIVYNSVPLEQGESCGIHSNHAAEWTCCLCRRPICRECCAREISPLTSFGPHWYCRHCIDAARTIETKFFEIISVKECCSKHIHLPKVFVCKSCGLPLCCSCAYFTAKSVFKKIPHDGPYCLGCFRMATIGSRHHVWFSGNDLASRLF
jgi:hypothetical protein